MVAAGGAWGLVVSPAAAVDRHGQVVLAEGDHAAAEPADGPLTPSAFFELEADEDAQPDDQIADLLVRLFVLRQCREIVNRRHQCVDLFLGAQVGVGDRPWYRVFSNLPYHRRLLGHEAVERLGDGLVAGLVLLGGHPPLGRRDVVLETCQVFPKVC